jgi:transaldolase
MKLLLDTANIKEIQEWYLYLRGEVHGVTTNPLLLHEAGIKSVDGKIKLIKQISEIDEHMDVFFQCTEENHIYELNDIWQGLNKKINLVAKVTMDLDHMHLFKIAEGRKGIKRAATTCYDLVQIHQAAEMDLDYTMVYYAKNDVKTLMQDAVKMKNDYCYNINLVAASFRTKNDYIDAIKSGIDMATVRPEHLNVIFKNNNVEADVKMLEEYM